MESDMCGRSNIFCEDFLMIVSETLHFTLKGETNDRENYNRFCNLYINNSSGGGITLSPPYEAYFAESGPDA